MSLIQWIKKHMTALKYDGTLWKLVLDLSTSNPVDIISNINDISSISGRFLSKNNSILYSWGDGLYGQLGDGTWSIRDYPVRVYGLANVISSSGFTNNSAAATGNGTMWIWGEYNFDGIGEKVPKQVNIDKLNTEYQYIDSIEISGQDICQLPLEGNTTLTYTAIVNDQNGVPMADESVNWSVYDSRNNPVSTLNISNDGVLTIDSNAKSDIYFIEARSATDSYVYITMSILLTAPAPVLTGLSWEKGSSYGTTKAATVPDGILKYVVGTANMMVQPKVGDVSSAYKNILNSNTDISVIAGQHIFIVCVDKDGAITNWSDVTVDESNINLELIKGDVNNDSAINALDLALMKLYLLGRTGNINKMCSDINLDGEIDAIDFALLKKQLLN